MSPEQIAEKMRRELRTVKKTHRAGEGAERKSQRGGSSSGGCSPDLYRALA